jgi:hypothetical protein
MISTKNVNSARSKSLAVVVTVDADRRVNAYPGPCPLCVPSAGLMPTYAGDPGMIFQNGQRGEPW